MDEQLAERKLPIESLRLSSSSSSASSPSQPPTPTPLTPPPPLASSTPKNRRVPTGVGKGSPGKPRKVNVSKRAERNRMKRKPELQCATHNSPSKRKGPETSRAGSSSPPPPQSPAHEITQETSKQAPPVPEQLDIQMRNATAEKKRVKLYQQISGAAPDEVPCNDELHLFHDDMENWTTLEPDMVAVLRTRFVQLTSLPKDPDDADFLNAIVLLHNISNGISNCTNHMIGYLVCRAIAVEQNNVQQITETIATNFMRMRQHKYTIALNECGCIECRDVIAFDQRYEWCDLFSPSLTCFFFPLD